MHLNKAEATSAFSGGTVLNQNLESYISLLAVRDPKASGELLLSVEDYNDQRGSRMQFAKAAIKANMPELARAYFEKAMKDDPDTRPLEVAELWFRDGDRHKAVELLQDVIQSASDGDNIVSWERLDKAREAVRILKQLEPGLTDQELRNKRRVPAYLLDK
jgi:predicted Zn-dependent protease